MVVFKVFSTCKTFLKVDIKSQILPELISLCLYNNIWTRFYLLLCTRRVRSNHLEEFYKHSTKSTGNLLWGLFYNKAVSWRPVTSLNAESGTGVFLWIFWNLYKNIYFANVCEGMSLISKIFTGVSFCKMLGFCYKQKR